MCWAVALAMAAPCWGGGGAPLSPPCHGWAHLCRLLSGNASHPALTLVPPSKNTSWRGAKHNSQFLLLPSFPGSHIIAGPGRESKPGTRRREPGEIVPKMPFPLGEERLCCHRVSHHSRLCAWQGGKAPGKPFLGCPGAPGKPHHSQCTPCAGALGIPCLVPQRLPQ